MKLYGMTLCYNESEMIPYIMPYYERLGFDKLIVYDNESTDNSVELLKQYPFVEVRTFHTGLKRNTILSKLKSKIWKEFVDKEPDTWMYISDFDEVIYYNGNFRNYLELKSKQGYSYLNQLMLELISDEMPDISDGKLIHTKCEKGVWWNKQCGCKMTLFKLDKTKELTYSPGAHNNIWITFIPKKSLNNMEIKSLHIKYIGYEYMRLRSKRNAERRSNEDKQLNYGNLYEKLKNDQNFKNDWEQKKRNAIKVIDYIK